MRASTPCRGAHLSIGSPTVNVEEAFERAEKAWFTFLVRENLGQLRYALGDGFDLDRDRLFVGISEGDDSRYGPRSVGIAAVTIRPKFVDVLYYLRESEEEYHTYKYTVSLDAASDIVNRYLGTRAALAFRSLSK
jgi:hypothetical protein